MTRQEPKTTPAGVVTGTEQARDQATPTATAARATNNGRSLLVRDLGWSQADEADTHFRLRPFEEDWDAPGMDAYDDL